jgi:hypothetical protein
MAGEVTMTETVPPDLRFAKRFGRLQREVGDAIESFYRDVGEAKDDSATAAMPRGSFPPGTVFMDDGRMLVILSVCQTDSGQRALGVPATTWQYLKTLSGLRWLQRWFPMEYRYYPLLHEALNSRPRDASDIQRWTRYLAERA